MRKSRILAMVSRHQNRRTALIFVIRHGQVPARLLSRVAWPGRMLIGATLGPLALLLIFVVLFAIQGRLGVFSLAHTESLWPFSVLVSTISFLVYAALLHRRLLKTEH